MFNPAYTNDATTDHARVVNLRISEEEVFGCRIWKFQIDLSHQFKQKLVFIHEMFDEIHN